MLVMLLTIGNGKHTITEEYLGKDNSCKKKKKKNMEDLTLM